MLFTSALILLLRCGIWESSFRDEAYSSLHPATFIVARRLRGLLLHGACSPSSWSSSPRSLRGSVQSFHGYWTEASILLSNIFLHFLDPNSNKNQIYFVVSVNVQRQIKSRRRRRRRRVDLRCIGSKERGRMILGLLDQKESMGKKYDPCQKN